MQSNSPSLEKFAARKLAGLEKRQLRRRLKESNNSVGMQVERDGQTYVNFCSNDYLGLANDPRVIKAAQDATARYGAGSGASRLVTGGHHLLFELERRLARLKGTEDCIVFGSGYLANLAIAPALLGVGDLVLVDELAHACIHAGAELSRAQIRKFRHNDLDHLRELLDTERSAYRHAMIMTDGVFSMDGDFAPLPEMLALADRYDAWTLVDDAHAVGVVGDGKGSSAYFEPQATPPLQMGTLSKALGSYGGYLCASHTVCELLRTRARPLVFTTALPPASIGAALAALDIVESDAKRRERPLELAKRFCAAVGLPVPVSPIVPVLLGSEARALDASARLQDQGFLVTAIRPPTVPRGTARLRITFSATHTEADIDQLAQGVRLILQETSETA
ncbi:MAG: 8-amino-7-oxononanoate synthase [Maricaulis sp.]|uniref:8-amino-7-oxononanoate synthase n=1 Tax=Maricaulis sp. TaxID=1486257 RepID=UPI001B0A8E10|nr:8-amino-7-oxononanoate synthase [Maricaulis sp.]MBO6846619.1 8-amino-7-oxononanoate synthase [Maricaulis sp.]MBO6877144.1 8-amino-7-oxononanoate synthase [Maricaulis sp.]